MTCRPLKQFSSGAFFDRRRPATLNTPPQSPIKPQPIPEDSYLCDEGDLPPMANVISSPLAKIRPNPSTSFLGSSGLWGLTPLGTPLKLPPPPKAAFSHLLYEVFTQLKDFKLEADLKVPVLNKARGGRRVETHARIVLGRQGRLDAAQLKFDPYWGPNTFPNAAAEVIQHIPIIGIFTMYRLLSVEMDPQSRKIVGKAKFLFIPIERDLQEGLVEAGKIPPHLVNGPGYNLRKSIPEYSWQASDILEQMLTHDQTEGFKEIGQATTLDQIVPLFEKGKVRITGDFSNQEIKIGPVTLKFAPKQAKEEHRLVLTGGLERPKMKIWGLKSIEIKHSDGTVRLTRLQKNPPPLELSWKFDFSDLSATKAHIAKLDSHGFRIENLSNDPKKNLTFTLKKGYSLKNLWLAFQDGAPRVYAEKLTARQGELEGMGILFRTSPGDEAVISKFRLHFKKGFPHIRGNISGRATGSLQYQKDGAEVAWLQFNRLIGSGVLSTGLGVEEEGYFQLKGNFSTQIPSLRLHVDSSKLHGYVHTEISDAEVTGNSTLTVWPQAGRAQIKEFKKDEPLKVRGTSGKVLFHQDTSLVPGWSDLEKNLGKSAKKIKTHLNIDLKEIGFNVHQMDIRRNSPVSGHVPSLEILDAKLGDIRLQGDLYGSLWVRLPGGIIHPLQISKKAKMVDAKVEIGVLRDLVENGARQIRFRDIFISGEESQATLSLRDQKRCGFDRQRLNARLQLFGFHPDTKALQIEGLGQPFHFFLKNPGYLGGCFKVE